VLGSTALNFASAGYLAVFVLWVVGPGSAVGLDRALYGTLTAALAVGALVGAVCADRLRRRLGEARLLGGAWLANSLLLAVPVLIPRAGAIAAAFVLVGFTNMVGNVTGQALRQRLVPGHLLGRVGGAARTVGYGSIPLGAAAGGLLAEAAGLPAVFLGAVALSAAFAGWVIRVVPQRTIDDADADSWDAGGMGSTGAGSAGTREVPTVAGDAGPARPPAQQGVQRAVPREERRW
jgi:MFS family permease